MGNTGGPGSEAGQRSLEQTLSDPLGDIRLEELLLHLQGRVADIHAAQERLRLLLDAVMAIGTDLEVRGVLARITESASRLVGARYGALALVDADRRIFDFITHGISPEERDLIGQIPQGKGVLGLLIQESRPLLLSDIGEHPSSYGFPPHHPPMTTLLGVPIHVRGEIYGYLYLADKEGGAEFTEDDKEAVIALAAGAGIAIQNARLFDMERRRQRWLEAASEITQLLVGEVDRDEAMRLVVSRAREVANADIVAIALIDQDSAERELVLEVIEGMDMEALAGERIPNEGILGTVVESGERVLVEDAAKDDRIDLTASADWSDRLRLIGPVMFTPMVTPDQVLGSLIVAWTRESSHLYGGEAEAQLVEAFAGQAALAIQRVRAQEDRDRLLLLEDRDRIARDLHDVVIQRLFATGMRLQTAVQLTTRPAVRDRLNDAIDALDETTRDIRSAIFRLHRKPGMASVRDELQEEIDGARDVLGFLPRLVTRGPLDHGLPDEVHDDLVAVLRECLANAARHASPTTVEVLITVDEDLALKVTDDGVGVPDAARRSGLANMQARAERLGGGCDVRAGLSGGTVVEWRVPIGR